MRDELLGHDGYGTSEDQRALLLDNTERLESQSKRLEYGRRAATETGTCFWPLNFAYKSISLITVILCLEGVLNKRRTGAHLGGIDIKVPKN